MTTPQEYLAANAPYAAKYDPKNREPFKKNLIITCMDQRIDPVTQFGVKFGESHVVRNAGGSVAEAIRSIVFSQYYGTRHIAVFHHTHCKRFALTYDIVKDHMKSLGASMDDKDLLHARDIMLLTADCKTPEESVKRDCDYLKNHPLVAKETTITGWVYDVDTGKITQIV